VVDCIHMRSRYATHCYWTQNNSKKTVTPTPRLAHEQTIKLIEVVGIRGVLLMFSLFNVLGIGTSGRRGIVAAFSSRASQCAPFHATTFAIIRLGRLRAWATSLYLCICFSTAIFVQGSQRVAPCRIFLSPFSTRC
jgi:hypothetical protein